MAEAKRRRGEYWAGSGAVLAASAVLLFRWWPVPRALDPNRPILESILDDAVLVGLLRLAVVAAALYLIASVPALVVGARWAKGLGTTGIVADDAPEEASMALAQSRLDVTVLESLNLDLARERAELWELVDVETTPN